MPKTTDKSQVPPISTEVALHELGNGLAISFATVQNELARYPNELGAFLLDEVEVTIPVRLRIDELGQIRVHMIEDNSDKSEGGQIHLRIRPVLGATQTTPKCADQPLSTLGDILPTEAIQRLEELRVFSIEDLLRIARDAAGQRAVEKLLPEVKLNTVVERATLFTLPDLTPRLAETLLQIGVTSPTDLVKRNSKDLANEINKRLEGKTDKILTPEDVNNFQSSIRLLTQLRLPNSQPKP